MYLLYQNLRQLQEHCTLWHNTVFLLLMLLSVSHFIFLSKTKTNQSFIDTLSFVTNYSCNMYLLLECFLILFLIYKHVLLTICWGQLV